MNTTSLITELPGYDGKLPYKTFGGYIDINHGKHIYYILIQAKRNPSNAPLLFWTNGGPGCSGLMGMFEEIGPYQINKEGKVVINPWDWTKFANIVFIEQPIGVGFSYADTKTAYHSDDSKSAKDNFEFMLKFFEKYEKLSKNPVYITSESYGGHYVPLWVEQILNYNNTLDERGLAKLKIHLKGCIMINPYVNFLSGTEAQVETYWGHQRIPAKTWRKFTKHGCHITKKHNWNSSWKKGHCQRLSYEVDDIVGKVNPYAINYPMCISHQQNTLTNIFKKHNKTIKNSYQPCRDSITAKYLNRLNVRKKLRARLTKRKWKACSDIVKYRDYDTKQSVVPLINDILNHRKLEGFRIFIISGTNDAICGTIGTQEWLNELTMKPEKLWKQYFVNKEPMGYINKYKAGRNKLLFATVNGAGHEVPMYKPQASYELVKKFILKQI